MKRRAWVVAVLVVALGAACEPLPGPGPEVLTGLVDATEIDIASKVPGRVLEVLVREGDRVAKGSTLATLESQELAAKVDQVSAAIEAAQARLAIAREGARDEEKAALRRQLSAAREQVDIARKTFDRTAALLDKGALPQAKYDEAEFRLSVSKDQLGALQSKYQLVEAGARDEELQALEALVRQAEGTLAEVLAYQDETTQRAPLAAEVAEVVLHPGELAATGYPIVTLVDLADVWATFSVREDLLPKLPIGTTLEVEVPALGRRVPMQVFHVAVMGEFATWRATSAKDRFDLKTFEVKLRPVTPVEGLRPGMTVRWTVG